MNDPQDLLYTNNFLNTNIINETEINEQTKNYDRFIEYQNNQNTEETNNTMKYLNILFKRPIFMSKILSYC